MKLGVLFFGHLRDYSRCLQSINDNLLSLHDCDVFVHTWDTVDHNTISFHGRTSDLKKIDNSFVENELRKYISSIDVKIEHQEKYDKEEIIHSRLIDGFKFSTEGIHYSFYSLSQAYNLLLNYQNKNYVQYDYIVVIRPDIYLNSVFPIDSVLQQSKILGLDLERCRFFASKTLDSSSEISLYINEPNDLLYFGKQSVIEKYIKGNSLLTNDFIKQHSINVVSIYTAKELELGLIPIPISFSLGTDWSFYGWRNNNLLEYKKGKKVKKVFMKLLKWCFGPFLRIYKKYPWIRY